MPATEPSRGATQSHATLLVERWRPANLRSVVGQSEAVSALRKFAESWTNTHRPPRLRAALLEGAPGTGKTSAARALAQEMGWGLIEMSASDARNESAIQQIAGRASLTNTFTEDGRYLSSAEGGRNLILLDDVDGISTRGGAAEESAPRFPKAPPSFREFLRSRYREVEALNEAWGLKQGEPPGPYASFAELPASAPRGQLAQRKAVQQDLADFQPAAKKSDLTDRGGLGAVADLIRNSRQPLVMTAIDPRALSRASVVFRTGVVRVRFYPLRNEVVRAHLHRVAGEERLEVPASSIDTIVHHAKGDLRAALNDLELAGTLHALKAQGRVPASLDPDQVLGSRDIQGNLFEAVSDILEKPRFFRTGQVLDALNVSPDELLPWIEENLPRHARSPAELAQGFDMLARAERHLARAQRWRIWTLWSYATELMTGGVSLSLHPQGPPPPGPRGQTEFPRFLSAMGGSRGHRQAREALALKVGHHDHLSKRKARITMLPFLEAMYRAAPSGARGSPNSLEARHLELVRISRELELDARDLAYLLQVEEDHPSVQNLLREEQGSKGPEAEEAAREKEGPAPAKKGSRRGQRTLDGL